MLKRLIVNTSYAMQTSKRYQANKRFFYNLLENDKYRYKKYIDIFMMTLIFISVAVLIREVKYPVDDTLLYFSTYIISIIFFIEYILRLWVSSSVSEIIVQHADHDSFLGINLSLTKVLLKVFKVKITYMLSVRAIIDLLAILPFFHELRLLRIFILFRVFKLFRYAKSFQILAGVLATKKFEFITLALFSSIVIFVSSVLIYVMEANNDASPINTLFDALYWSIVTISTVGYGDVTPITNEGRFVAMIVIVTGIAVLAFTTSLVVSAFTDKLDEIKEIKTIENLSKLKEFYLVCGYESVAQELCKKLSSSSHNIIILDDDISRVEKANKDGLTALHYSPGKVLSYKNLGIDLKKQVKAVLCLREDDVENVYTALTVRSFDTEVFMLSLLMNNSNRHKLEFAGINHLVYPQELVAMITKEFIGKPVAFEVVHAMRSDNSNVHIDELHVAIRVRENFKTVGALGNHDYRVIVLGLYQNATDKFLFKPQKSTPIEVGDYIIAIGYKVFIEEFERHLHTKVRDA